MCLPLSARLVQPINKLLTVSPPQHPIHTPQERQKPSLHARCYLRLGLYEWHHADAAEQHLAHCMDLLRVRPAVHSVHSVHSVQYIQNRNACTL